MKMSSPEIIGGSIYGRCVNGMGIVCTLIEYSDGSVTIEYSLSAASK